MGDLPTIQDLQNADIDLQTLVSFANDPAGNVTPRLGDPYPNIRQLANNAAFSASGITNVADIAARDTFYTTTENQDKLVYVNNNNGAADDPANGVYEYVSGASRIAQGYYNGFQPITDLAQAWAESDTAPDPDDPTSKSAKTWAADVAASAAQIVGIAGVQRPGGVRIAGLSDAITDVTVAEDDRVVEYASATGARYTFADGAFQKAQIASDTVVLPEAAGVRVPGLPVKAAAVTTLADGRVAAVVGSDARSYFLKRDGSGYFAPIDNPNDFDVVIYGSSVAGLTALIRSAFRRGKRVCVIEPYSNFGGMHAAGLSYADHSTDATAETTIMGGDTNSIYFARIIATDGSSNHKYLFEPKTAEKVAQSIIADYAVRAVRSSPIDGRRGVLMGSDVRGPKILGIWTEAGLITGQTFIDASYEGDLMAAALGPSAYVVGRESADTYGETYAGYQTPAVNAGMGSGFTSYTGAGSPAALGYPFIADPVETAGQADNRVQSYCFRLPLTRVAANRLPFVKPYGYDSSLYTSYLEYLKVCNTVTFCRAHGTTDFGAQGNIAGSKVNFNGADLMNAQFDYGDGNWTKRRAIVDEHVLWQQGLFWCIANDPIARDYGLGALQDDANDVSGGGAAAIGLCADEFEGSPYGHGWPWWFYPREGRRLKAMVTMTAADLSATGTTVNSTTPGQPTKTHSIGKWQYNWDTHACQAFLPTGTTDRVAFEGTPANAATPSATYQIPIEAILPPTGACSNLIVPVCAGFSHVAWAPQRLEIPMGFCGEAAGELATWLCDNPSKSAQQFDYTALAARLTQFGSKL